MKTAERSIALLCALAGSLLILICFNACYGLQNGLSDCEGIYIKGIEEHLILIDNSEPVVMHDMTDSGGEIFEGFETGDKIAISYDIIAESYPCSTGVYSLTLLQRGDFSNVNRQVYDQLCEMGWVDSLD